MTKETVKDRKRKKLKRFRKVTNIILASSMLLMTSTPLVANAIEDNILGVPLEKFNGITNSSSQLEGTLEYYEKNRKVDGYYVKYMLDSYTYMYHILNVSEQLGENKTSVIPDHVKSYNQSLKEPLTDDDQILATETTTGDGGKTFLIQTTTSDATSKISTLVGTSSSNDDKADRPTMWGQLNKLRSELELEGTGKHDVDEIALSESLVYAKENISSIRYLFTAIKEYLVEFNGTTNEDDKLKEYFVDTYDYVSQIAIESGITGLADMDLFGNTIGIDFNATGEDALKYVADYEQNEFSDSDLLTEDSIASYSEYTMKGIAASSTFRPFETNLNTTDAFSFLGDEVQVFHEMFGTKRKLILTVTDAYNNLNQGTNYKSIGEFKLMTLRQLVEKPKDTKVLYTDNLEYNLQEVKELQDATAKKKDDDEEDIELENEDLDDIKETTDKENGNTGFWSKTWNSVKNSTQKAYYWAKNLHPVIDFLLVDSGYYLGGENIKTEVFISGDVSSMNVTKKHVKENQDKIELSRLILNNIVEEYWGFNAKLKLNKDLDKPLYIDIYGNILSASGIVIIPAMSNPYMFNSTEDEIGMKVFNRAFIESYPEFTVRKENLVVKSADSDKLALFADPLSEEQMSKDEEKYDVTYQGNLTESAKKEVTDKKEKPKENKDEGKVEEEASGSLNEEEIPFVPGIDFYVAKAKDGKKGNKTIYVPKLSPIAYKFDNNYEPKKSVDVFSFTQSRGKQLDSYYEIRSNMEEVSDINRALMVNDYTVKLSYNEGSTEVISFKEFPDSEEIKRYMYITNLEYLSKIENNEFIDKKSYSEIHKKMLAEVLLHGVADLSVINSLTPEIIETIFQQWQNFTLEKSNDRYQNSLNGSKDNNILYVKSIEEIKSVKNILPVVYKIILFIAIIAIIFNIIMSVVVKENKLKQVLKVFTVMYIVTFMFNIMTASTNKLVNEPTRWMFSDETIYWTLVEQEKEANKTVILKEGKLTTEEDTFGSSIKLYKVGYSYPYKFLTDTNDGQSISIDEFYEHYLNNEGLFRSQNNEMYMDGQFLTIDTKTIFNSSSIVVKDPEDDVFLKLDHEIYNQPELAYYMPYYMFIDNMVYNLNTLTELNRRIPSDIAYSNGDIKTTGRMHEFINSAMFLDYELFQKRLNEYETGDKISEELSVAEVKSVIEKYGEENDFLGIRKILGLTKGDDLAPFTEEGLKKVQNTGWYPQIEDKISLAEAQQLERKALKVNDKVKAFMLKLSEVSEDVADEHIIKTIALYASLEFNKEFNFLALNKGPTAIELNKVPIERLLMGLTLAREDLIDASINSYPSLLLQQEGYFGLMVSTANDYMIIFINFIKPFIVAVLWSAIGLVIFIRKVVLPDENNRSIVGSIKLMGMYILSSLAYSGALIITVKLVNLTSWSLMSQCLLIVFNLAYILLLAYLMYAVLADFWNMGNSILFKGLEKTLKNMTQAFTQSVRSVPLFDKMLGRNLERVESSSRSLQDRLGVKSDNFADNIGGTNIMDPIDFALDKLKKKDRNPNDFNRYDSMGTGLGNQGSYKMDDDLRETSYGIDSETERSRVVEEPKPIDLSNLNQLEELKERPKVKSDVSPIQNRYSNNVNNTTQTETVRPTYESSDAIDYLNNRTNEHYRP